MGFFKRLLSVGSKKDKSKPVKVSNKQQRAEPPAQDPSRMLLDAEAEAESTITRMLRSSSVRALAQRDYLSPPSPLREWPSCPYRI
jgi:hypothetical protein